MRGAKKSVNGDIRKGSTRHWNNLEDYWSCAGGLSAGIVIGTYLRDPKNSGTDPITVDGIYGRRRRKRDDSRE